MRRKDREVTDFDTMLKIVKKCDIVRLGLADGEFPYIVPVNFAYTVQGTQLAFYIHGAMSGRKYELMRKNPKCSFEMDFPLEIDCMEETKSITMRYESVMGTAEIQFLDDAEKKSVMDKILLQRYEETRNFAYNETILQRTAVMKLTVLDWTAKSNPVRKEQA